MINKYSITILITLIVLLCMFLTIPLESVNSITDLNYYILLHEVLYPTLVIGIPIIGIVSAVIYKIDNLEI